MNRHRSSSGRIASGVASIVLATVSGEALATDGVIEINDAKAVAGGVTPGDTPDYPVTISQLGSYRLTGDLAFSGTNTDIIEITADDVTLDLNGFTIRCLFFINPCVGTGIGVNAASQSNVTIRNGTVRDMGRFGIEVGSSATIEGVRILSNGGSGIAAGSNATIEGVHALSNGGKGIEAAGTGVAITDSTASLNGFDGIDAPAFSNVRGNRANNNGSDGVRVGFGSIVTSNTAAQNSLDGIDAIRSTVTNNTVSSNTMNGISVSGGGAVIGNTATFNTRCGLLLTAPAVGYAQNVLKDNNGNSSNRQVDGGTQIGSNYCGGHVCGTGATTSCP